MKTILAYGDSLTWGLDGETFRRHAYDDRWTSVLEAGLHGAARVISEGLCGRTTAYDWPDRWDNKNGAALLPALLETHGPLDLVILFVGGNDMNPWLRKTTAEAAEGMRVLVSIVRRYPTESGERLPEILIVAPHQVTEPGPDFAGDNAEARTWAIEQTGLVAAAYRALADELGVAFFDAGMVSKAHARDGIHLDAANTRAIGTALVPIVADLIGHKETEAA